MQSLLARDADPSDMHGTVSGSVREGDHEREIVMLQNQLSEMRAELEKQMRDWLEASSIIDCSVGTNSFWK
jgi:hypothetical protein